ncbi:MAG TPA: methyltransferase domain-containing protein [Thermoanaerobaculia bacterium]|nr:methyltransferase domain-containing protein [Thermoanaerobaculia bacterium]
MSIADNPDYAEGAYDELSFWSARFGALLFEHLELRPNVDGLDVACGTGFPLFELAHAHGPSSRWTGVDIWPAAIKRARRKLAVYGLSNVELHEGDAAALPFDDATFDLITSNLGVNNFADPLAAVRECHRVARPGARIVITTNFTGHLADFYDIYRKTLRELGRENLIPALNAQEAHRGTRDTIEQLLLDGGFRIARIVESETFLSYASGTAMLRHPLVGFFLEGWRTVTEDADVWEAIEAKLNAASPLRMRVPMLYGEGVRQ